MAIADLINTLAKHEVEFVIVGGMAAISYGWLDTEGDRNCAFEVADDGRLRCLPTAGLSSHLTVFLNCDGDPLYSNQSCGNLPDVARIPTLDVCRSSTRLARRGPVPELAHLQGRSSRSVA